MRKTIKWVSTLIALIVLVSSICVIPVSAADVSYSASSTSGATGETVSISVTMSSSVEIWGSNISLGYNPAELQYVSHTQGGAVSTGSINNSGSSVNFSGVFGQKSGTVFTVTFKILKESGKAALTLSSTENIDYEGNTYTCSTSNGSVTVVNEKAIEKLSIDKTSLTLKKGDQSRLTVTVTPEDATDKTITFSSSDESVAKVSKDGVVTAVGGGTATIIAKAGGKIVDCEVTVNVAQTGIKATGNTSRDVKVGDSLKLSVVKVPADATNDYSTKWTTSNPKIATVSSNGTVTAVTAGVATITAKQNNWTVTYKITVAEKNEESTTEESTTEEPTTEETTTEESTTEVPTTETTTRPVYEVPTSEKFSLVEPTSNENITENNKENSDRYLYMLILATAGVVAVVAGAVTFFVTKGYYGAKKKPKQKIVVEEKFKR